MADENNASNGDAAYRPGGSGRTVASSTSSYEGASDTSAATATRTATSGARRKLRTPRARRMKLSLTRIDPWSATKVGFMLSFAISLILAIALVVAWMVFMGSDIMASITSMVSSSGLDSLTNGLDSVFTTSHVVSVIVILAVFNVVLLTILSAINAFLYNITARLVGGIRVTLGDD